MVEERITDGRRIAELLASELDGREDDELAFVSVTNADPDVEATPEGARAYDVECEGRRLARAIVHDDRVRLVVDRGADAALAAATDSGLDAESEDSVVVTVASGAAVKRATAVVQAAVRDAEQSLEF